MFVIRGIDIKNKKNPGYKPCQKAEMKYVATNDRPVRKYVYLRIQIRLCKGNCRWRERMMIFYDNSRKLLASYDVILLSCSAE